MTTPANPRSSATTPMRTAARRSNERGRVDPPDLVSIYAERLRAAEGAPPPFAPLPVLRVGRGTPGFRRGRSASTTGSNLVAAGPPRRLSRRGRLVAAGAAVATIVTTALAGAALAG